MERQEIITRTARHYLDDDGIFHTICLPGTEQTLDDAKENIQATAKLDGTRRRPLLIDIRPLKSQTGGAREYCGRAEGSRYFSAAAVLIDSPLSRMIGNLFLGFNKSSAAELRLFSSEAEAIAWLKTFLN